MMVPESTQDNELFTGSFKWNHSVCANNHSHSARRWE